MILEIIISLLLAFGINLDETQVEVLDDKTGISYGVGSNTTVINSEVDPIRFTLMMDDRGNYYLVQK